MVTKTCSIPVEEDGDAAFWSNYLDSADAAGVKAQPLPSGEQIDAATSMTSSSYESSDSAISDRRAGTAALLESAKLLLTGEVDRPFIERPLLPASTLDDTRKNAATYRKLFDLAFVRAAMQDTSKWYRMTNLRLGAGSFSFMPLCKPVVSGNARVDWAGMGEQAIETLTSWAPKPCGAVRFWAVKSDGAVAPAEFLASFRSPRCPLCNTITACEEDSDHFVSINAIHVFGSYLFDLHSFDNLDATVGAYYAEKVVGGVSCALYGELGLFVLYYLFLLRRILDSNVALRLADFCHMKATLTSTTIGDCLKVLGTSLLDDLQYQLCMAAPGLVQDTSSASHLQSVPSLALASACTRKVEVLSDVKVVGGSVSENQDYKYRMEENFRSKFGDISSDDTAYASITREVGLALNKMVEVIEQQIVECDSAIDRLSTPITKEMAGSKKKAEKFENIRQKHLAKATARKKSLAQRHSEATMLASFATNAIKVPTRRRVHWHVSILKGHGEELQNVIALTAALESMRDSLVDGTIMGPGRMSIKRQQRNRYSRTWTNKDVWSGDSSPEDQWDRQDELAFTQPGQQTAITNTSSSSSGRHEQDGTTHSTSTSSQYITWDGFNSRMRGNAAARAREMLARCGGQPHRIRGLIISWIHNAVMTAALDNAIAQEMGQSGRSIRRLLRSLQTLLRQQPASSDDADDLSRRLETVAELSRQKYAHLLVNRLVLPEAISRYAEGSVSKLFNMSLSAIFSCDASAVEQMARRWNKYMHSLNGNIDASSSANWRQLSASRILWNNTGTKVEERNILLPEISWLRILPPDAKVVTPPKAAFPSAAIGYDREWQLSPAMMNIVTSNRDFLGMDQVSAQWARLARGFEQRALVASLIPAFERPREVGGSVANYGALRLAALASTFDEPWVIFDPVPRNNPFLCPSRVIAATRVAFKIHVIDVNLWTYLQIIRTEVISYMEGANPVDVALGSNCVSHCPGNQLDGLTDVAIIAFVQSVWNYELADIEVSLIPVAGDGAPIRCEFLPRLRKFPAGKVPEYYYIRVLPGNDSTVQHRVIDVPAGPVALPELTNGGGLRVLSTSADLTVAQVSNQLDLKGLILSSTMTDASGTYFSLIRETKRVYGWMLDVDCGHYYHVLYTSGILTKTDLPSQSNRSKFCTTIEFVSDVGLYRQLCEDVFSLQQLWDSYQVSILSRAGDLVARGASDEYDASAVCSKMGFLAQCGGLPMISLMQVAGLVGAPFVDGYNRSRTAWLARWCVDDIVSVCPTTYNEANFFYLGLSPSSLCEIGDLNNLMTELKANSFDAAITDPRWVFYTPSGQLIERQMAFNAAQYLAQAADGSWALLNEFILIQPTNLRGGLLGTTKKALPLDQAVKGKHLVRWSLGKSSWGLRQFPLARAPALFTPADKMTIQGFRLEASPAQSTPPASTDVDVEHNPPDLTPPQPPPAQMGEAAPGQA
nr:hypothetical protein [Molussus totiviridae 1]